MPAIGQQEKSMMLRIYYLTPEVPHLTVTTASRTVLSRFPLQQLDLLCECAAFTVAIADLVIDSVPSGEVFS